MGEANMKFAHGQSDETIKMCMEVIRQVPNAIEPFQSLSLRAMATAFSLHPRYVNVEDVNLLIELYINQRVYDKLLEALVQHCGVCLVYADNSIHVCHDGLDTVKLPPNLKPTQCKTPDVMPVDLRSKLIVCMIHLSYIDALLDVSKVLFSENVEEVGDLFLDVAEAHMKLNIVKYQMIFVRN